MFSNTEVIVTQIVMTQYIVASLSLSVISQRPIYRTYHTTHDQNTWERDLEYEMWKTGYD